MGRPQNTSEIRQFLGMVNQMSKFAPRLSERTKPIRDLLSSKHVWIWQDPQDDAFRKVKLDLISSQVLSLYDPNCDTKVSIDDGLGAVLRQKTADSICF